MAQSLNTKVDLVMEGTSYAGLNSYGKIMIGDRAFEYYNENNVEDNIQIPWQSIEYVIASVMFRGHYIPRFAIRTKYKENKSKDFSFSARHPKELLRAVNKYVPSDRMVRSLTLWQVIKRKLGIGSKNKKTA